MTKRPITLRAWKREILPPIPINQGDILSRTVIITLEDYNGKLIDLTGAAVRVHFTKPDATTVYLSAQIINPLLGCVSVTLDSQCVAVKGAVTAIVQVTGADGSNLYLTGLSFDVADIDIENSIESTNEFTALTEALSTVGNIDNKIDEVVLEGNTLSYVIKTDTSDPPQPKSKILTGRVTVYLTGANTPGTAHVEFPADFFKKVPVVITNPVTGSPGIAVTGCNANNVTTTGADINLVRSDDVKTTYVDWLAIQGGN